MKKINLILQSKGGVGKSFLTWLINQKLREQSVLFVDADQSTRTTFHRMGDARCKSFDLLDSNLKTDREKLLNLLAWAAEQPEEMVFVDFGAPESVEFLNALKVNYTIHEVKSLLEEMQLELNFNVVLSGGDTIKACSDYFMEVLETVENQYPITVWLNKGRFTKDDEPFINGIISNSELHGYIVRNFGSTSGETSDEILLTTMASGQDVVKDKLDMATKLKFNRLMNEIEL